MGSNLRSSLMPEEKRIALLAAFGELKQRVIWKYEEESLPGQPDNVMISNWVPQMDILGENYFMREIFLRGNKILKKNTAA